MKSMNGLELSRRFYEEFGVPMLHRDFAAYEELIAVGLCGAGSECFGFDDKISQDHDFEPGFCLFLPDEEIIDRRTAFLLERAYTRLPREFLGFRRQTVQPVGGNRHGVLRMDDFFISKIGRKDAALAPREWFAIPEQYLAEATNGAVFRDDVGLFSSIRKRLSYLPEDVRRKKLAGNLLLMAQSGQYNYPRCLAHNESAAAQLAVVGFVQHCLATIFLLNRRYLPYYKWQFRALRTLPLLSGCADPLEQLLTTGNERPEEKQALMEDLASTIITCLQEAQLTEAVCGDLEKHSYSVNDHVADASLRNEHILYGV